MAALTISFNVLTISKVIYDMKLELLWSSNCALLCLPPKDDLGAVEQVEMWENCRSDAPVLDFNTTNPNQPAGLPVHEAARTTVNRHNHHLTQKSLS